MGLSAIKPAHKPEPRVSPDGKMFICEDGTEVPILDGAQCFMKNPACYTETNTDFCRTVTAIRVLGIGYEKDMSYDPIKVDLIIPPDTEMRFDGGMVAEKVFVVKQMTEKGSERQTSGCIIHQSKDFWHSHWATHNTGKMTRVDQFYGENEWTADGRPHFVRWPKTGVRIYHSESEYNSIIEFKKE